MSEDLDLVQEMITLCEYRLGVRHIASCGIRAICAYYGGQQIYLPRLKREDSKTAETLRGILADAVGGISGDIILDEIMKMFGGVQLYIPMERRAFRKQISYEIKTKYDGTMETLRDLCREYHMSFTQVYRLWHQAETDKKQIELPFTF